MQMNVLKDYVISFSGLKDGVHSFDFEINDKFFEAFENNRFQQCDLKLEVEMDKQETMIQLRFSVEGEMKIECDRCLELYTQEVHVDEMLILKFGAENFEEAENILVLKEKEHEIKLAQHIYEYITLSLPMRLIHPEDEDGEPGCHPDFLDSYHKQEDADEEAPVDPRWEALKKLKNN